MKGSKFFNVGMVFNLGSNQREKVQIVVFGTFCKIYSVTQMPQ